MKTRSPEQIADMFKMSDEQRVFVQGDRAPEGEINQVAIEIGQMLKQKGWEANVGAYGGFVQLFEKSGINIHPHKNAYKKELKYNEDAVEAIDTAEIAKEIFKGEDLTEDKLKDTSWALRMAMFLIKSKAFVFFPGTRGTRAHLLSALAYNMVHEHPKPIALVGWQEDKVNLDKKSETGLPDQEEAWMSTFADEFSKSHPEWFKQFKTSETKNAVEFLTSNSESK